MSEKKKKRFIVLLLFLSCLISGYLLLKDDGSAPKQLHQFSQADSLLEQEFDQFRISEDQIRVRSVEVDSQFTRKTYEVAVPPGFSKTQLHAELHDNFHPMDVRLPAEIHFPDEDFEIHLMYNGTIFRTVRLETDPDLTLNRNFASIVFAYDEVPPQAELEAIEELGEPISIAIIVENPLQANELQDDLAPAYSDVVFWLQDENGNSIPGPNSARESSKFNQLLESVPEAQVLSFTSASNLDSDLRQHGQIKLIDASEALMLDPSAGQNVFRQELQKLAQQAQNFRQPIAVIMGSDESIEWLNQELPELKKSGLRIIKPPNINY